MKWLAGPIILAGLLSLAGCGAAGNQGTAVGQSLTAIREPQTEARFAALQKAAAPRLQVALIDREVASDILLEQRTGAFEYWLTSDGVHLILQDGMLQGTRGLGDGLLASDLSEPLARVRGLQEGPSDRFHTYLNGEDQTVTRTYRCDIRRTRDITIEVTGGSVATVLMREDCNSIDQQFENLYWVDPRNGRIVQSRQWVGPFTGNLSTRIILP